MADNKNQHFVPRCHLRPFSLNEEGRAINLYNLERDRAIPRVAVKHQCSGDYFYGDDKRLDDAIRTVEGEYASVIRGLLGDDPAITPKDDIVLRRFMYLQNLRTEAVSRKAAEMVLSMHEVPGANIEKPDFREEMREAVISAMVTYAKTMAIVDDLKLRIVRNRTDLDFVTSDDPAVLTNRLHLQNPRWRLNGFGVKSAGVVFIMPLSPRLCCILYDGDIYSIPHRNGWVVTNRDADVAALNDHQFLASYANIYFRDWDRRNLVEEAANDARARRLPSSHDIVHAVLEDETDWGKKFTVIPKDEIDTQRELLVHIKRNYPTPAAWPSLMRYRADRRTAYSNNTGTGLTRRGCLNNGFVTGTGYRRIRV